VKIGYGPNKSPNNAENIARRGSGSVPGPALTAQRARGINFGMPSGSPDPPTAEYIRLPKPGERCPLTGLSRTSLVEVINERDRESGEFLVLQFTKKRYGKQRGIRMINRASLLAHLDKRAREQSQRRFAKGVSNPEGYGVEDVISDFDLWCDFSDPLGEATEKSWRRLSRAERIGVLDRLGLLAPLET